MERQLLLLFILLTLCGYSARTQSLADHRWQHRLILLLADSPDHPQLAQQRLLLQAEPEALQERKLWVYQVTPRTAHLVFPETRAWESGERLYPTLKETEAEFEALLIGLDGGVKLRRNQVLSPDVIFDRIDQMPMRRAEMRKN